MQGAAQAKAFLAVVVFSLLSEKVECMDETDELLRENQRCIKPSEVPNLEKVVWCACELWRSFRPNLPG